MQLNVHEVSQLLSVSDKTIYRWVSQGEIPAYKFKDQYRFNEAEILEWAVIRKINISPKLFETPEAKNFVNPSLAEVLRNGGIFFRLEGTDFRSAVGSLIKALPLFDETVRQFLLESYWAREELNSTAIGDGIAIPHSRVRVVPYIVRPMAALGFLEEPVDFKALDGQPVRILFTVLSPYLQAHLHVLSRFLLALRDAGFREALRKQELRETILSHCRRIDESIDRAKNPN
ncbi:MAG: PTS sugar transporter subunit IIA [Candidatus Omnitrophota bacterium]